MSLRSLFPALLVGVFALGCTGGGEKPAAQDDMIDESTVQRAAEPEEGQAVSFAEHVQPILESRCVACHGADAPSGDLALTDFDALMKGGAAGAAVVPGDPDASLLTQRMHAPTGEGQMPPGGGATDEEIATIERWIKDGAEQN